MYNCFSGEPVNFVLNLSYRNIIIGFGVLNTFFVVWAVAESDLIQCDVYVGNYIINDLMISYIVLASMALEKYDLEKRHLEIALWFVKSYKSEE